MVWCYPMHTCPAMCFLKENLCTYLIYIFSIITQVIIKILALSLAENSVIFRYNHLRRGDYCIAGGKIFKIAASRFVNVSEAFHNKSCLL